MRDTLRMAYALNTSISIHKVALTLPSLGSFSGKFYNPRFILSTVLHFNERFMHISTIEIIVMEHMTFFH